MTRKGYERLDAVRIKFRTTPEFVTAHIWIDGEERLEIARLNRFVLPGNAGDKLYHAWVDAVSALFYAALDRTTGHVGFTGFRAKPNYQGEDRGNATEW